MPSATSWLTKKLVFHCKAKLKYFLVCDRINSRSCWVCSYHFKSMLWDFGWVEGSLCSPFDREPLDGEPQGCFCMPITECWLTFSKHPWTREWPPYLENSMMNAKVYSWQISQSSANKWKSTEKTPLTRTLSCTDVSGPFLLKQTDSHSFTKWDGPAGFLFQRGKPALIWQPQKMPISLHHFVWPD